MAQESYKLKPTLVDIRCRITAAMVLAEVYAESHPQHAEALRHFYEEINQSFQDLREVVYGKQKVD
jgi:hypothetical protein